MSRGSVSLDQGHPLRGRARAAGEQGQRWVLAGALLFACACGGSEGSASAPPLPGAAPDATSVAPAAAPASSESTPSDAGSPEPTPPPPAQPPPADDPPASSGPAPGANLDLPCSAGTQPLCLDDERVVLCQGGQPIQTSCVRVCDLYGLNPGPCDGGCQCGEPSSPQCVLASEDYCACLALVGSGECTLEARERLYLGCYVNGIAGELMACTAEFRAARPDAAIDEAFCADLNESCD